jgi:hypothetical protein
MTEEEWNQSHPEQCTQYVEAWKTKQYRNEQRSAALQHIIAVSGGVKISGRPPRLTDFLPHKNKPKVSAELSEARLKIAFHAMAKAQQRKEGNYNGQ